MINPNIALAVNTVGNFPDPLEQYAKLQGVRNLISQRPIQQAQLEKLQLDNEQTRLENAGLPGKQEASAARAETDRKTAESLAEHQRLGSLKEKASMLANALGSVKYAPEEEKSARYQAVRANAIKSGIIKPEDAPEQYDPAFVDQHFYSAVTAEQQIQHKHQELTDKIAQAAADRAATLAPFVERKASAEATGIEQKVAGKEPIQPAEQARIEESKQTADYKNYLLSQKEGYKGNFEQWQTADANRKRSNTNIVLPGLNQPSTLTGDAYLKTLPTSTAGLVKAISEGRETLSGRTGTAAMQLKAAVQQYDPTFSEQRGQIRKAFTTGKEGQNIGALNTAIVHLGRLGDTAEALQNGSFTPANQLFNYFKDKFGIETVTNFELLKDAVAGEMAAALKGNATDIEIANLKKSIRASNSPEQMRGVVGEGMTVLNDKANTYQERYQKESDGDTNWSPILPTAKAQLEKHGVGKKPGSSSRIKIISVK